MEEDDLQTEEEESESELGILAIQPFHTHKVQPPIYLFPEPVLLGNMPEGEQFRYFCGTGQPQQNNAQKFIYKQTFRVLHFHGLPRPTKIFHYENFP